MRMAITSDTVRMRGGAIDRNDGSGEREKSLAFAWVNAWLGKKDSWSWRKERKTNRKRREEQKVIGGEWKRNLKFRGESE